MLAPLGLTVDLGLAWTYLDCLASSICDVDAVLLYTMVYIPRFPTVWHTT